MNDQIILSAKGIHKNYEVGGGEISVLKGIDLDIYLGEIVSIIGPSGVGKSTLLNIIGTLDRPTSGDVTVKGESVFEMGDRRLANFRNNSMGFVFQFHHLLPEFSAKENVMMPALITGKSIKDVEGRAEQLLSDVGLVDRAAHKPSELSGGERQRVAVARALMNEPLMVLADEPSGNLDRQNAEALYDLLWRLREEKGQTFVIVTHNEELAGRSDRTIRMVDGVVS